MKVRLKFSVTFRDKVIEEELEYDITSITDDMNDYQRYVEMRFFIEGVFEDWKESLFIAEDWSVLEENKNKE